MVGSRFRSKSGSKPTGSAGNSADTGRLLSRHIIGYGAVAGPYEMLRAPALAILPALYAKEFGWAMVTISFAMLFLRFSDGASDLAVGYLSDRTRSRWGRRKPWLVGSIFVAIPAAYGLYVPGESANLWTFFICYFFLYISWSMFEVPYTAWSAELSGRYEDRSRLALSRGLGQNVGLFLLTLLPLLPFLPTTEMNFAALNVAFWVILVVYPLGIIYAVALIPDGSMTAVQQKKLGFRETFQAIRANRPLSLFLAVAFLSDFATGCLTALFFLFFDTYLGVGAAFSLIFLTAIGVSTVSLRLWQILLNRSSKKGVLIASISGGVVHGAAIYFLEPGPHALAVFIVYLSVFYILNVARDVALYATFGDIVDYDMLKTGANRSGQYSSAWMVLRKIALATAPAFAFFIAGAAGYDPSAEVQTQSATFALKAANGYLPALFLLLALVPALFFPLSRAKHEVIRKRLEQRQARSDRSAQSAAAGDR